MLSLLGTLAPAVADPGRKVVVLRVEGKLEPAAKKQLEDQLLELARRVDAKATQVDFTFADAAAVSSCVGELETCRTSVLDEFGVDEMLVTTAESTPDGGASVTVRRASKAQATQTVTFTTRSETVGPDTTKGVGPWYGAPPPPEPARAAPAPGDPVADPPPPIDEGRGRGVGRPYLAGVIGGGVLAAVGVVLWTRASSTQTDIDAAATSSAADLHHLQDLESEGRSFALWGNITVLAGVALGATCGYFYWRARGRSARTVAIGPSLHPHGAGLTLTIGGLP